MANLFFKKDLNNSSGQAMCSFSIDYYNRFLSGWEPFLEPWRYGSHIFVRGTCLRLPKLYYLIYSCTVNWNRKSTADLSPKRIVFNVFAQDVMNVNVTRTLIDLYHNVKEVWTQDYYNPKEK